MGQGARAAGGNGSSFSTKVRRWPISSANRTLCMSRKRGPSNRPRPSATVHFYLPSPTLGGLYFCSLHSRPHAIHLGVESAMVRWPGELQRSEERRVGKEC